MSTLYRYLRNHLFFRDPGLTRLTFAARTMLALLAAGLLCYALAVWGDFGTPGVILGVIAAQLTMLLARQSSRRDRIATCLVMLAGNWCGILLLNALQAHPYLDIVILPVLVSAGFLAQSFNARLGAAMLAAAWIFMFTVYLSAAGSETEWHLGAVTGGILAAMLVRFVIWRDDRTLSVGLLVLSHRLVLIDFVEAVSRLGGAEGLTRLQTRMQPVANAMVANPQMNELLRNALADLRLSIEVAILKDHLAGRTIAIALRSDNVASGNHEIDHAARQVAVRLQEVRQTAGETAGETRHSAAAGTAPSGGPSRKALVKRSMQVLVATSLATGLGYWISAHYWPWAVIVAMFLYLGTDSAGHILNKGLNSAVGVLLGVLFGLALTDLLGAIPQVEILLLPLLLFFALYLMPVNYAMGVALITVLLGLIYQLLGLPAQSVLVLRLGEVLVGAMAGTLAALLVFPHRPVVLLKSRAAHLIAALADAIDPQSEPIHHSELRRRFAAVVAAADLGSLGGLMIERSRVRSSLADLSCLLHLIEVYRSLQLDEVDLDLRSRIACDLRQLADQICNAVDAGASKTDSGNGEHRVRLAPGVLLDSDKQTNTVPNNVVCQNHDQQAPAIQSGATEERLADINNRVLRSIEEVLATLSRRVSTPAA